MDRLPTLEESITDLHRRQTLEEYIADLQSQYSIILYKMRQHNNILQGKLNHLKRHLEKEYGLQADGEDEADLGIQFVCDVTTDHSTDDETHSEQNVTRDNFDNPDKTDDQEEITHNVPKAQTLATEQGLEEMVEKLKHSYQERLSLKKSLQHLRKVGVYERQKREQRHLFIIMDSTLTDSSFV